MDIRATKHRVPRAASLLTLGVALAVAIAGGGAATGAGGQRPNIVVFMTDDQTVRDMRAMDYTAELFEERGAGFENAITSFPLCCPSRASFLTGQYAHNHGLWSNEPRNGGGYDGFDNSDTLPMALRRAGYRTGFVGKYFNGYGRSRETRTVPAGWDRWVARADSSYFGFDLVVGGKVKRHGAHPSCRHFTGRPRAKRCPKGGPGPYLTDVLGRQAAAFASRSATRDEPYFLWLSMYAPHREGIRQLGHRWDPRPAVRHRGAFSRAPLHRSPSFNEADVADKPPSLRARPRMSRKKIAMLRWQNRARLASLLAVDEAMERLMDALRRSGELDSTYVFFLSDNGYLLGEHRRVGKTRFYEESLRVPFYALGPAMPEGTTVAAPVANVDLPATIHELAGATPLREPDGMSLLDTLADPAAEERVILLENPVSRGLRTARHMYARHDLAAAPEHELYDLRRDPFQLDSVHDDPANDEVIRRLAERLDELRGCAGSSCY